jgi:hypothetical protein
MVISRGLKPDDDGTIDGSELFGKVVIVLLGRHDGQPSRFSSKGHPEHIADDMAKVFVIRRPRDPSDHRHQPVDPHLAFAQQRSHRAGPFQIVGRSMFGHAPGPASSAFAYCPTTMTSLPKPPPSLFTQTSCMLVCYDKQESV